MERFICILLLLFPTIVSSQTATIQDCGGAIPICQNVYYELNSFPGTGNYPNEINYPQSCTYESYSIWYTFTAQTSGNFSFIITPNNTNGSGDDYDWSVFDLTNATCSDIYTNPGLEVSCNSYGLYNAFNGQTGASTAMGGSGNHNGPGNFNGPPFNWDIPVIAGNIYVMMVSNWTGSPFGYTVDFSSSTAQIFDNVPPYISAITSNIGCGTTSITFEFSENILCSTIAACDINLTGPGGPYTITNITGAACASGGTQERIFTITVSPAISTSGAYSLDLNASACNSVTDLCGNVAPAGSLPFNVTAITTNITVQNANCGLNNGSATASASGGSGIFTYTWSTTPPQNGATATSLPAGIYTVSVSDGSCTSTASATIINTGGLTLQISIVNEDCGQLNGTATVSASGGSGVYTYQWSTTPAQTTATAINLGSGTYYVTVNDGTCTEMDTAVVSNNSNLNAAISNIQNESCGMSNGSATVTVNGGVPPIQYLWNTPIPMQTTATATNLPAGNYSVSVSDAVGCTAILSATILMGNGPVASITSIDAHCDQADGSATASATGGGTGVYSYIWSNGGTTATINNLLAGTYYVTVDDGYCDATASIVISNLPGPIAEFFYQPNPITIDHPQVVFTSGTQNATSWQWDFGDGTGTFYGQSVMHPFYVVSDYLITLIVEDGYGCTDTISELVTVHDIFTFYIPSSFTPNGDGINDLFQAYGISWEEGTFDMTIFNRWGNIIYHTDDPAKPWNGGLNNNPSPDSFIPAVYVYKIKVKALNEYDKVYLGRVTLVK